MARLISVNVGLPREIQWKGRTIRTGIFKDPVNGRCRVDRLNVAGDGQGDLIGHGGEQRAVFVYQLGSYQYWQERLNRHDLVHGQFGENFTIEGLPDDEVCIGDRFRIGSALFEVTQPRVTCYRIGIRLDVPQMATLLTASGRPGFYFRVLEEGEVGAGDEIIPVGAAPDRMSVAVINALLYTPDHSRERLERSVKIAALSPGWRNSFTALLQSGAMGNVGLVPEGAQHPAAPGFRPLRVSAVESESSDVLSLTLESSDGEALPTPLPGQFIVVKLLRDGAAPPLFRSYSLSALPSSERYRISVKVEPHGLAGEYLRELLKRGDTVAVSSPRGSFILPPGEGPVVLLSAGIGATPVLAMLHSLSADHSTRPTWWLQAARDGAHHPFAAEVSRLLLTLRCAHRYVCYSQPAPTDTLGAQYDATGHFSREMFATIGLPADAQVYLCGPMRFMQDMKGLLMQLGFTAGQIHMEIFNGGESMTPGVVHATTHPPHRPATEAPSGPLVSFARSGIAARWSRTLYPNILELAEACDVPVRWSCRSGVCHNCESGLIAGSIVNDPQPLENPVAGNILICCAQPLNDLVIDL